MCGKGKVYRRTVLTVMCRSVSQCNAVFTIYDIQSESILVTPTSKEVLHCGLQRAQTTEL